ncbi:hypothetical protein GGF46_000659 [Coemansia sp. RSA 552]|nr:hypothetical protein GGF46_000659 [Coemansia sp. RSA 552]
MSDYYNYNSSNGGSQGYSHGYGGNGYGNDQGYGGGDPYQHQQGYPPSQQQQEQYPPQQQGYPPQQQGYPPQQQQQQQGYENYAHPPVQPQEYGQQSMAPDQQSHQNTFGPQNPYDPRAQSDNQSAHERNSMNDRESHHSGYSRDNRTEYPDEANFGEDGDRGVKDFFMKTSYDEYGTEQAHLSKTKFGMGMVLSGAAIYAAKKTYDKYKEKKANDEMQAAGGMGAVGEYQSQSTVAGYPTDNKVNYGSQNGGAYGPYGNN